MKKNVLELTGSFRQGGSERQVVQLSRLLHNEGSYRVFVGTLDGGGELRSEIEALGITEIPEFKLTSFYNTNFLRQAFRCAEFIRMNNISIVHSHDFYTNIFGMASALIARKPARVASKREMFSKSENQFWVERRAFGLADRVLANAEAVRNFLIQSGVSEAKIVTVHNGLDLDRLAVPDQSQREEILRRLDLPCANAMHFVTIVANLRLELKNHRMFLMAAKKVKQKISNVTFVVAGEGELTESLTIFAEELGISKDVRFTGKCSIVAELLSISDVCVLSSKSEGFSNSILEYMAASKPVVSTFVGGAGEAIVEGETGFLVESNDHERMADRIIEILSNPDLGSEMGKRGRIVVEEKFSLSAQMNKTLSLYEEALSAKK